MDQNTLKYMIAQNTRLKMLIERYWKNQGQTPPNMRLEKHSAYSTVAIGLRSDMLNGLPRSPTIEPQRSIYGLELPSQVIVL